MNNVVTQRFIKCHNKLREENRVRSSRQFALSLDYLPQSLSEILKGRRDVTIELLRKAVEKYKINPVFLYTGEGPMFMAEDNNKDFRVLTIVTNAEDDERIVHVPLPAQAGYAGEMADPGFIQELPTYTLPDYKYKVGTHRSFDVAGDSMEPTLLEGDKVVCSFVEPSQWPNTLKDNHVYVIVTRGDVVVKRIVNCLVKDDTLELHSDNNFYRPYPVAANDIREVWSVRAKVSPILSAPQSSQPPLSKEVQDLKRTINQQSQIIRDLNVSLQQLMARQEASQMRIDDE